MWKQEEQLALHVKESNQHSAPSRWLHLILLPSQRRVQEGRSELLFARETGPWIGDRNITPTPCLLCLNDSFRDVSLPTLVKDPDPSIPLFFFLPVRQSTLPPHACSLILALSSLIHDYFFSDREDLFKQESFEYRPIAFFIQGARLEDHNSPYMLALA